MGNKVDQFAKEKMEKGKGKVIDAISETMDLYAVPPSAGHLYAVMYFQSQMNLDEMREELGMSKPSMSTSVRKLQEIEMVKKKFQRGTRKHTYAAEKDFFHSFIAFYCQMWEREAKTNMDAIKEAEGMFAEILDDSTVSENIREEVAGHYDMLDKSKVYYRWLERLVSSIRSEEIFEFLPKDPSDKN